MSKMILKRSLALGALMAFVITGSVMAGENLYPEVDSYGTRYIETGYEYLSTDYIYSINGGVVELRGYDYIEDTAFKDCYLVNKTTNSLVYGGAVQRKGDLTIKNAYFEGNNATAKNSKNSYGGAVAHQNGKLSITGTWFIDNSTNYYKNGSAIYTSNAYTGSKIEDCKFYDNDSGSPIWVAGNSSDIEFKNNTFKNNCGGIQVEATGAKITLTGKNFFDNNTSEGATGAPKAAIYNKGEVVFAKDSHTRFLNNTTDIVSLYAVNDKGTVTQDGRVKVEEGAIVESNSGINSTGDFKLNGTLKVGADSKFSNLNGINGTFEFLQEGINVEVTNNTTTGMKFVANGTVNDKVNGDIEKLIGKKFAGNDDGAAFELKRGAIVGDVTGRLIKGEDGYYQLDTSTLYEKPHEGNAAVSHNANIAMMAWRAETNDLNKRMGELRNANGEHGVWVRMVGGEDEFKSVEYEYTQYQLGYDEKLSVDPSWTVGVALNYTDGESKFTDGSGENTHKGVSIYGSKLNDDGSFIDLIAKYSRLEHDLTSNGDKGDYSTNGYSVSTEYGKRFQQGKGLWIEPQVELTYGKVKSAEYQLGDKTVSQDAMESLVGRVGFSLGKDISKGNVYARASYLYDFEGKTNMAFANSGAKREFKYDLGGGWWEVGVGANINLSKATYVYADIEKTFGGEVDTNWQWNLGVRYSF